MITMNDTMLYGAIALLVVIVLVVAVLLPKVLNKDRKILKEKLSELSAEFSAIFNFSRDPETSQLKLQKIASRFDNLIGKILYFYGCNDPSVNRQIRMAMEKKLYTYEEFKVVKAFHLMRNRIIHEDLVLSQSDVQLISDAMQIIKRLMS